MQRGQAKLFRASLRGPVEPAPRMASTLYCDFNSQARKCQAKSKTAFYGANAMTIQMSIGNSDLSSKLKNGGNAE
ncbi:hypothetical protein BH20ACT23_BH20ACT23_25080 [soil metagenome]